MIKWDSASDRFVHVSSSTITLYECMTYDPFAYHRIKRIEQVPVFQCFDWSPQDRDLIALGQTNGTASIIHLLRTEDSVKLPVKQQRACTSVAFNKTGLLAVGLDKVRHDPSLVIWNVQKSVSISQLATSEAVSSVHWCEDNPNYLLAGLNFRWLRLIDIRADAASSAVMSISTKAVLNLTVDPSEPNVFASSQGSTVCIWDRRYVNGEPRLTLGNSSTKASKICQLKFMPARSGHLLSLSDNSTVSLWQLDYGRVTNSISKPNPTPDGSMRVTTHCQGMSVRYFVGC